MSGEDLATTEPDNDGGAETSAVSWPLGEEDAEEETAQEEEDVAEFAPANPGGLVRPQPAGSERPETP